MGVTAAYVFAAQMVNFPVAAGVSGHLLGSLLVAVLLGPHAAAVVMAAVFLIQALFFLDGGHTALGANFLNMGLAGAYGGYAVYRTLAGPAPDARRARIAAGVAAWVAVELGAALTAGELVLSGRAEVARIFPIMLGIHALIGVAEALITVTGLSLLLQARPELVTGQGAKRSGVASAWLSGAGLVVLALLAPLASPAPDGFEWATHRAGLPEVSSPPLLPGPMPDYTLPGLEETAWAGAAVSLLGAGLMLASLGGWWRSRRRRPVSAGRVLAATPPRRIAPQLQLAMVLALAVTGALLPDHRADRLFVLLAVTTGWVVLSRVRLGWLLGRAWLLVPILGLVFVSGRAGPGSGAALAGPLVLPLLRAGISLLATAAFLASTPEPEVLRALRGLRLPSALADTILFAVRYLRVLGEDAAQMLRARTARSAGVGPLSLRAAASGGIVGALFLRSLERSERISLAMAARGHGAGPLAAALPPPEAPPLRDWGVLGGVALLLLGVWVWP